MAKKKKRNNNSLIILVAEIVAVIVLVVVLVLILTKSNGGCNGGKDNKATTEASTTVAEGQSGETQTEAVPISAKNQKILDEAAVMAAMYDYDGAIEYVKTNIANYDSDANAVVFLTECETNKSGLVKWADNTQITHVFFHTLIADCKTAFSAYNADQYGKVMTTIDEFNKIIQSMYERGYVMVSLYDIAEVDETTGKMKYKDIYLPPGKIPFVLSEDDVSYYDYMVATGGYASRLVITEDGSIMNEWDVPKRDAENNIVYGDDGYPLVEETIVGAYDMVPLIDEFVKKHPDFSYHGHKGTIALTGYNGILGYRTSYIEYGTDEALQTVWNDLFYNGTFDSDHAIECAKKVHAYTVENIEEEREKAKTVAAAMKAEGWDFASHTWGHMTMSKVVDQNTGNITSDQMYFDTTWWKTEVEPLLGDVDIIIFAQGADIGSWKGYTNENAAFNYLNSQGFHYFCNVDSSRYFVQVKQDVGDCGYFRQGRRNLDGYAIFKALMYPEQQIVEDLFDPLEVFDADIRPLPVLDVVLPDWYDGSTLVKPE